MIEIKCDVCLGEGHDTESHGKNGGARRGAGRKKGATDIEIAKRISSIELNEVVTEQEVRERFRILNEVYGWYDVILSQEAFPDLILEKAGRVIRAEVELKSSSFNSHRHDKNGCDFVICWVHNRLDLPVPVFEIAFIWDNYKKRKSEY